MRRTQIYLDEAQHCALSKRARSRGVTNSNLVREAIDEYLAKPDDAGERLQRFRAAVGEVAGIAPYLPPGEEYVRELRKSDAARDAKLDARLRGKRPARAPR